jgi:hypothetical protein
VILWGLCIATAMAACGEPEELARGRSALGGEPGGDPDDPGDPDCPPEVECNKGQQGRETLGLNGSSAPQTFHASQAYWETPAGKPPIVSAALDPLGLVVMANQGGVLQRLPADALAGLMLPVSPTGSLHIKQAIGNDAKGRARYVVEFLKGATWTPLCLGNAYAYALPGWFYSASTSHFRASSVDGAFACRDSAAAKALRWDFGPKDGDSRQDPFTAAIRMARAEYCADGNPYTVNGTTIEWAAIDGLGHDAIADDTSVPTLPTSGSFYFEAAWRGDGPDLGSGEPEVGNTVECLSKLRWQSLRPKGPCPSILADPRYPYDEIVPRRHFCEQYEGFSGTPNREFLQRLRDDKGVSVVSFSQYNDLGLYSWFNPTTRDRLATTQGFWSTIVGQVVAPKPGYKVDGPTTAEQAWVAGILKDPRDHTRALRLFYNSATHEYRSTTSPFFGVQVCSPPGSCGPNPWQLKGILGYVFTDAMYVGPPFKAVELHNFTRKELNDDNELVIVDVALLRKDSFRGQYTMDATIEGYGFE